jgi:hypothetical protein
VANAKRRLARNKKRFAKVNCDPEHDLKMLKFFLGRYPQVRPSYPQVIYDVIKNTPRVLRRVVLILSVENDRLTE